MTYIFNFWKSKNTLPNNCLVKEEIKADTADYFKTNSKKNKKIHIKTYRIQLMLFKKCM